MLMCECVCLLQKAQSQKGKAAEKSPQEEKAPTVSMSTDTDTLNSQITDQGNKIRKLKEAKAPQVSGRMYLMQISWGLDSLKVLSLKMRLSVKS